MIQFEEHRVAQPLAKRVLPPLLTLPKAEVSWHWQERLKETAFALIDLIEMGLNIWRYLWLVPFKNSTAACWVGIETIKSDVFWTSPECDFASWSAKYRKLFLSWVLVSNMKVFSPRKLGKMNPFWRSYFSKGLVQPPTIVSLYHFSLYFLSRSILSGW